MLGAWKFQQRKFCKYGKSGLAFEENFFVSELAKEGFFPSKRDHTCEEGRSNRIVEEKVAHVSIFGNAHV